MLYAQKAIYTSYQKFLLTNEFQSTQLLLRGVSAAIEQKVNNKTIKEILQFEIRRAQAMGYYKESKFSNAIKQLNPAVSSGPVIGGSFSSGLSDALVLLADCYSALGRRDDALRSAKLAVNIAHERLDRANKVRSHVWKSLSLSCH